MEVIYQVLPRIWGKGKFSEWDAKAFAYLKSLNVTAVWYTGGGLGVYGNSNCT